MAETLITQACGACGTGGRTVQLVSRWLCTDSSNTVSRPGLDAVTMQLLAVTPRPHRHTSYAGPLLLHGVNCSKRSLVAVDEYLAQLTTGVHFDTAPYYSSRIPS
jgi:hypothetical protein